jgi:hypothetical protein
MDGRAEVARLTFGMVAVSSVGSSNNSISSSPRSSRIWCTVGW